MVSGARAVADHFPAGVAAPVTLLLRDDEANFSLRRGVELVAVTTPGVPELVGPIHGYDL